MWIQTQHSVKSRRVADTRVNLAQILSQICPSINKGYKDSSVSSQNPLETSKLSGGSLSEPADHFPKPLKACHSSFKNVQLLLSTSHHSQKAASLPPFVVKAEPKPRFSFISMPYCSWPERNTRNPLSAALIPLHARRS
jgi:hypothetical protein